MNFNEFLTWLAGGGSIIAVSFIFERMAWFQKLTSDARQWVMFAAASVFSLGAYATNVYVSPDVLAQLAPIFGIEAGIFGILFLSKAFHKVDKQ